MIRRICIQSAIVCSLFFSMHVGAKEGVDHEANVEKVKVKLSLQEFSETASSLAAYTHAPRSSFFARVADKYARKANCGSSFFDAGRSGFSMSAYDRMDPLCKQNILNAHHGVLQITSSLVGSIDSAYFIKSVQPRLETACSELINQGCDGLDLKSEFLHNPIFASTYVLLMRNARQTCLIRTNTPAWGIDTMKWLSKHFSGEQNESFPLFFDPAGDIGSSLTEELRHAREYNDRVSCGFFIYLTNAFLEWGDL